MKHASIIALVAILAPAAAAAQPAATTSPPAAPAPTHAEVPRHYHPDVAGGLALGSTIAAWGVSIAWVERERGDANPYVIGAMMAAAPSAGRWYTGELWSPWLLVRAAGVAATMYGAGVTRACNSIVPGDQVGCDVDEGLVLAGVVLVGFGTVADIITAPGKANEANRARARRLSIAPQLGPGHTGIGVAGTF